MMLNSLFTLKTKNNIIMKKNEQTLVGIVRTTVLAFFAKLKTVTRI